MPVGKRAAGILLLLLFLPGCAPKKQEPPPSRIVCRIQIIGFHRAAGEGGIYEKEEDMGKILLHLRRISFRKNGNPRFAGSGKDYRIILELSDGREVSYTETAAGTLRKGSDPPVSIPPGLTEELHLLLPTLSAEDPPGSDP